MCVLFWGCIDCLTQGARTHGQAGRPAGLQAGTSRQAGRKGQNETETLTGLLNQNDKQPDRQIGSQDFHCRVRPRRGLGREERLFDNYEGARGKRTGRRRERNGLRERNDKENDKERDSQRESEKRQKLERSEPEED